MNIKSTAHKPVQVIAALLAVAAFVLAGCSSNASSHKAPAATAVSGTVVEIKLLSFMPKNMTVKVGTTVTWRDDSPITHTVTSGAVIGVDATTGLRSGQTPTGLFNAKLRGSGTTFSYTFTKPGTYSYYCSIHYGMNATITVTA